MKNKKLFAILTLVCFMFTLMPVAAFAADPVISISADVNEKGECYLTSTNTGAEGLKLCKNTDGTWKATFLTIGAGAEGNVTVVDAAANVGVKYALCKTDANGAYVPASNEVAITQAMANKVDGITGSVADSISYVEADETTVAVKTPVAFNLNMRTTQNNLFTNVDDVYVWVTEVGKNVPVDTVTVAKVATADDKQPVNVFKIANAKTDDNQFTVAFNAAGNYEVHASVNMPTMTSGAISNVSEFVNDAAVVEVYSAGTLTADMMQLTVKYAGETGKVLFDGDEAPKALAVKANNVEEAPVVVEFATKDGSPLQNMTLKVEPAGAINVVAKDANKGFNTGVTGKVEFLVSGSAEGNYKVYVSFGQFEVAIPVKVGATSANSIKVIEEPTGAIDILGETVIDELDFAMYDVNGNKLVATDVDGWKEAAKVGTNYVTIVEQPAKAKLKNDNVYFNGTNVVLTKAIAAEGTYTFKVVLDNGNYAIGSVTVKAFTSPVKLMVVYPGTVELGSTANMLKLVWVDANGIQKDATGKVELAANGYAVKSYNTKTGVLVVEEDEKYVGATITITAVDSRNDLVATTTVKVADEAKALAFASDVAEVKVNNTIKVNVVDTQGNVVALGNDADFGKKAIVREINYIILDKPEGAKVFANTVDATKLGSQGYFTMNLTSDKVGVVEVQAILKVEYTADGSQLPVVKYYTGTQEIAVGMDSFEDVVVMSIGSKEIVVNADVKEMLCEAVIKDSRTFVPFRAGLEALGATVDYVDGQVIAEMNGVKVVMEAGKTAYTVNGVAKTADVAPYLNVEASTTMVPAKFVAEAFGINVDFTTNPDGTVADVIFSN